MNTKYILVLDIGTTTAKSIIFSQTGKEIALHAIPYSFLDRPQGHYEQDPEEVYNAVVNSAQLAVEKAKKDIPEMKISAISIVCQGGSLVPCDAKGKHTYPMITWMDTRSSKVTQSLIDSGDGEKIYEITGFLPSPGLPLSMIIWLKQNNPEVFASTEKWLSLNDYIINRLTGNFVTNYSSAGLTQLLNVDTQEWDDEMIELAGIKKEQLAELRKSDESAGNLAKEPAEKIGIGSVPVVNGVHDRTAEAIGLGHYAKGESWIGTGTAWVVCSIINAEQRKGKLTSNFHIIPNKRIASTLIGGLGTSIEWWVNELIKQQGGSRVEVLKSLDTLVDESPVGANSIGFDAFTGTGNEGSFTHETPEHSIADKTRAIYESIAFDFKKEYEQFEKEAEILGKLTLVGGATRSKEWPKIIAEILGITLEVSTYDHEPALGGAILAGRYLEIADSYEELYEIFKTDKVEIVPEQKNMEIYDKIYKERY